MSKTNLEIRNEIKDWITRSYLGPLNQREDKNIDLNEAPSSSLNRLATGSP